MDLRGREWISRTVRLNEEGSGGWRMGDGGKGEVERWKGWEREGGTVSDFSSFGSMVDWLEGGKVER